MIYYEKYGGEFDRTIIFLHSENAVHCFSKQYDFLARNYRVIVPHLPGFGRNANNMFSTEQAINEIVELAESFGKPVTLVGFCLGASLCLPLICRHEKLFNGAIMISPWLLKEIEDIEKAMKAQADKEKVIKNKLLSGISGLAMGLDKDERKAHGEFCQNMNMNSLMAAIDNGIKYEDYPEYVDVKIPMLALCGLREGIEVRKTVRTLSMQNPCCAYDMWDGAQQNIPFKYDKRLNKTIDDFIEKIYTK